MAIPIPICDVRIGERHRKDMGDLRKLADSIAREGLLHAIVVTTNRLLVVGERRLRACRDILKWKDIPCEVIDVASVHRCERDENDVRKDFTPSERAALAQAIIDEAGERRGRPRKAGEPKPSLFGEEEEQDDGEEEIRHNCVEFQPGTRTDEVAAEEAGFGSREDYRRVQKTLNKGTPDLVDALDRGDIAPSVAATIAHLPKPEQEKVVAQGPEAMKAKAKELREKAPPMPPEDKEAEAKARRGEGWHKAMHDLWRTLNGVRDFGGMDTLSDKWSRDGQAKVLADLNRIRSTIDEWISVLEQKLEE